MIIYWKRLNIALLGVSFVFFSGLNRSKRCLFARSSSFHFFPAAFKKQQTNTFLCVGILGSITISIIYWQADTLWALLKGRTTGKSTKRSKKLGRVRVRTLNESGYQNLQIIDEIKQKPDLSKTSEPVSPVLIPKKTVSIPAYDLLERHSISASYNPHQRLSSEELGNLPTDFIDPKYRGVGGSNRQSGSFKFFIDQKEEEDSDDQKVIEDEQQNKLNLVIMHSQLKEDRLKQQIEDQQVKQAVLNLSVREKEGKIIELKEKIHRKDQIIEQDIKGLPEVIQHLQNQLAQTEQHRRTVQEAYDDLSSELFDLQKTYTELHDTNQINNQTLEHMKEQLLEREEALNNKSNETDQLLECIERFKKNNNTLKEQLLQKEQALNDKSDETDQLLKCIERSKKENNTLKKQLLQTKQALKDKSNETDQLLECIEQAKNETNTLKEQYGRLKNQYDALKKIYDKSLNQVV